MKKIVIPSLFAAALLLAPSLHAQVGVTWNGSVSGTFTNNANWDGGVAPTNSTSGTYAVFTGTPTANQPLLAGARSIAGLDFQSAGWTLSGSTNVLSIGTFGLDSAGSGTNTVATAISVAVAGGTWTIGSGNTLDINALLGGANAFSLDGGGTLRLSGTVANTLSGTMTIGAANTVEIDKVNVAGLANQRVAIVNGTLRWLQAGVAANTAQLTVNPGGLVDLNGNNASFAFSGNERITLSGGTVQTGAGTWTFTGNNATAATVNGTSASTITGNVSFGGAAQDRGVQIFNNASGLDLNWQANILSGSNLNVTTGGSGGGEMSLGGSNAFGGNLSITGSTTVYLDHAYALGTVGSISTAGNAIAAGATLAVRGGINYAETGTTQIQFNSVPGFRSVSGNNIWNGAIVNPGGSGFIAANIQVDADSLTMNGSLGSFINSNSRNLAKTGAGALIYTNTANIAGTIFVEGGVFALANSGTVNARGGNTTLNGGVIAAPDNITMTTGTGNNQMRFGMDGGGWAAYGADISVDVGSLSTLVWGGSSAALLPSLTVASGTVSGFANGSGGLLQFGGAGYTGSESVLLTGGSGTGATASITVVNGEITQVTITNAGSGYTSAPTLSVGAPTGDGGTAHFLANGAPLILNSTVSQHKVTLVDNINLASSGAAFTGQREIRVLDNPNSSNDRAVIDSVISTDKSGVGIEKTGAGTLEFIAGRTQTYDGATTVSAGTLVVNGAISGAGSVTVASGATLSGTGSLAGAVSVSGKIAAGNSVGTISTGALSLTSSGALDVELGRSGITPVSDAVNVTGGVSLASGADLKLTLGSGLTNGSLNDIFYLVNNDDSDGISGVFTKLNGVNTTLDEGSSFSWNSQTWQITYAANFGSSFTGGNDIALMLVVPEPGSFLLLASGAGMLMIRRRRRN